jgi:uncharacterized protein YacL
MIFLGALAGVALASAALPAMLDLAKPQAWHTAISIALPVIAAVAGGIVGGSFNAPTVLGRASTMSAKSQVSFVLDTSAIIDGRIGDVAAGGIFAGNLIVPGFVLVELQGIADSSDRLRRARGRRGLDVLNRLRGLTEPKLVIDEHERPEFESQPVDQKLVLLAQHLHARIVTGDYNLNKVAQIHGVQVVNLNDLALALRPQCLPGETLEIRLVKTGEEPGQAVGYLDDGTMVVVEGAADRVNQSVKVTVTSVLQTSAGRMIFGR